MECDDGAEEGEDSVILWTDLEVPAANSSDRCFSYSARNPVLTNRVGTMDYYVNNQWEDNSKFKSLHLDTVNKSYTSAFTSL